MSSLFRTLCADRRFALCSMRKAPGFAVTAIVTLALGIGASSWVFSLVGTAPAVLSIALLAILVAAQAAAGIDPMQAQRSE